jgi:hypothetical protein
VPAGELPRVLDCEPRCPLVGLVVPYQGLARGLAERDPELEPRDGGGERLVEVFDCLDEVALAQDQLVSFRD